MVQEIIIPITNKMMKNQSDDRTKRKSPNLYLKSARVRSKLNLNIKLSKF